MKRIRCLSILLAVMLALMIPIEAFAATTSTVTVTFTTRLIALGATTPSTWDLSATPVAVSGTAETATGFFSTANTSNVSTNVTAGVTAATWEPTGLGTAVDHNDSGTPGTNAVAMKVSPNTGAFDIVVEYITPLELKHELGAATALLWEAKLWNTTAYVDQYAKQNTIILTAAAH